MVVSQTLNFRDLADSHILLTAVDLHLLNALPCPRKVTLRLADVTHGTGINHVIAQVELLVLTVHIILEVYLHLPVYFCHLRRDTERIQDLL